MYNTRSILLPISAHLLALVTRPFSTMCEAGLAGAAVVLMPADDCAGGAAAFVAVAAFVASREMVATVRAPRCATKDRVAGATRVNILAR